MLLNVMNQTAIVKDVCRVHGINDLNPRFGDAQQLSAELFKYSVLGDATEALIIQRVSLTELFAGIPQDITGLEFKDSAVGDLGRLDAALNADAVIEEVILNNDEPETAAVDDVLGVHFCNWKRLVGLRSLTRTEVALSTDGDYLTIDARDAVIYRGTVSVKFQ